VCEANFTAPIAGRNHDLS